MRKIVCFEKLSKKEKKKENLSYRNSWGNINPVMRVVPNKKIYNRRNIKNKIED